MKIRLLLCILLIPFVSQSALSQTTRTWTGLADGTTWSLAGNWDTGVPLDGDDAVFNSVTATITNVTTATVRDFIKTGTGTVTVQSGISVTRNISVGAGGGLTFSTGTVTLNGTGVQDIGGAGTTTFNNLTVNNAGSTVTSGPFPFFVIPLPPDFYAFANATNTVGNITVTGTMDIQRGSVSFGPTNSSTFSHTIGTLSIGSTSSTIVQTTSGSGSSARYTVTGNTAFAVNNSNSTSATVTVTGDLIVNATYADPTNGAVSLGLAAPFCNGGTATLTVQGNFNATSRMAFVANGFLSMVSGSGSAGAITLNVGTAGAAGDVIMTSTTTSSNFQGNGPGTTTPTINLLGGTTTTPAQYNVPYSVFSGGTPAANASSFMNVNGVYRVVNTSSMTIAAVPGRDLTINGTLIVEDGGEIAGATVGTGSTSPQLIMGTNGRLVVRDAAGLGDGSSATAFAFCINRRTAPNNWILTSINTAGTVEYNGTAAQTITARGGASAYNRLEINNASGGTLNGATNVNDQLILTNGNINTTTTNLLTLGSAATVSGGSNSSYVSGPVANTFTTSPLTKTYPLGSDGLYRRVDIAGSASTGTPTLRGDLITGSATAIASTASGEGVSDLRYYSFTPSDNTINAVAITNFRVNTDDGVGSFVSNTSLRLATTIGTGGTWDQNVLFPSNPNTTTLPITINTFSLSLSPTTTNLLYVSLGTTNPVDNPLPVELSSFTGRTVANGIELNWRTASELNNAGYVIFRNGAEVAHFREYPSLKGKGTSPVGAQYQFVDSRVQPGVEYRYTLRSIDFDGTVHDYATTVTLRAKPMVTEFRLDQNFPNPFNPSTVIQYQLPMSSEVKLVVYDMLGREVQPLVNTRQAAGSYQVQFNAASLTSGVYFYRLQAGTFVETKKMMLVK